MAALGGRLIVVDSHGNLVTMRPDGTDEVVLAQVVPGRSQVQQPTWSPDGTRVAWVHVEASEEGARSSVATAGGQGERPTASPTAIVPFYLSWDPTSSRIAYLGPSSPDVIELGIVDADDGEGTPLDTGQPFFFSWAPEGDQLLVHVGEDRLERLALDGSLTTVADRSCRSMD